MRTGEKVIVGVAALGITALILLAVMKPAQAAPPTTPPTNEEPAVCPWS